jgi:hypothetical protein
MRYFLGIIFLLLVTSVSAQNLGKGWKKDKKGQEQFFIAEELFYQENYLMSLEIYRELEVKYPNADILKFRIGVCLLHKTDEVAKTMDYLMDVKSRNPKALDIDFYLAQSYHLNGQFDKSLEYLEQVLQSKKTSPEVRKKAERLKLYNQNAKELVKDSVEVTISNIESPVNTGASEYVPVVTSDDSVMLYTYVGENSIGGLQAFPGRPDSTGIYFEDIYRTTKTDGKWSEPEPLNNTINTTGHDAAVGFSNDGQTLIIYKDESGGGDLYLSKLSGEEWSIPEPVKGDVNTGAWEGHATFSADMRTMYFASERPGGYGGRDIWMSTLQADGTWGNVRNMGPKVNTEENEDSPFLHPNGLILIFNSEGHNSMGGYDIFQTELTPVDSSWSEPGEPKNMGYPINTPGDDKYFVLGIDGTFGYYSSGAAGGYGQQDIYRITGELNIANPHIAQLTGTITLDSLPALATIIVKDDAGKLRNYYLNSNSTSGKYLVNLPQGRTYTVMCELNGYENQIGKINATMSEQSVLHLTQDFNFYTQAFLAKRNMKKDSVVTPPVITPPVKTDSVVTPPPTAIVTEYNDIVSKYGNAKAEGLIFRVQIAAYNFPDNYRYNHLTTLGTIDRIVLDDGITRFTMGKFATLGEAEAYRQRIIAAGQTDAFVTAERNGKRYLLKDLVAFNFFQ